MKSVLIAALVGISRAHRLSQPVGAPAVAITENRNYLHARGNGPGLGDCSPYQEGAAPLPDKDNWESFMAMREYSDYAKHAETPSNYSIAFENLNATINHASYIGVHTIRAYEPSVCANQCDLSPYCKAFNIYVSRDPSQDPGPGCANPPATANFKCALFGEQINATKAINKGQRQPPADNKGVEFYIRIRGSNGYNANAEVTEHKISPPVSGFKGPYVQNGAFNASKAVNEPADLIGTMHRAGPYNVQACARLCNKMTEQSKAEAEKNCATKDITQVCEFTPCNFFNAYTTQPNSSDSESATGFSCALYTLRMPDEFSTVTASQDAAGTEHRVIDSFAYDRHRAIKNYVHGAKFTGQDPKDALLSSIDAPMVCATETVTFVREHTATATVTVAAKGSLAPRAGSDEFAASNVRDVAGQPVAAEAMPTGVAERHATAADEVVVVGAKAANALSWKGWWSKVAGSKRGDGDDEEAEDSDVTSDSENDEEDAWVH